MVYQNNIIPSDALVRDKFQLKSFPKNLKI